MTVRHHHVASQDDLFFAKEVLDVNSVRLGIMISSFGIGGLIGSLFWASIPNLRHIGLLCIMAVMGWHATMIVFAASTNFYLSVAILVVTGDDVLIKPGNGTYSSNEDSSARVPRPNHGPADSSDLCPRFWQRGVWGGCRDAWRFDHCSNLRDGRHWDDGCPGFDCTEVTTILRIGGKNSTA